MGELDEKENPDGFDDDTEHFTDAEFSSSPLLSLSQNPARYRLTQKLRQEIEQRVAEGESGRYWYKDMQETLRVIFHDPPGQVIGSAHWVFIRSLAATSANNGVPQNVRYGFKGMAQAALKLPIIPYGQGQAQRRQPGYEDWRFNGWMESHYENMLRVAASLPLEGPKVQSFEAAMMGDEDAVVIDRWIIRAFRLPIGQRQRKVLVEVLPCRLLPHGGTLRGPGWRHRDGISVEFNPHESEGLFSEEAKSLGRQITLATRVIKDYTWATRTPTNAQYRVLANLIRRLAREAGWPPAQYQSALWTGMKLKYNPYGIENFVTYYKREFPDDPLGQENVLITRAYARQAGYYPPAWTVPLMEQVREGDE
jgi:hypothetical protein